jgi:hypothetical protein
MMLSKNLLDLNRLAQRWLALALLAALAGAQPMHAQADHSPSKTKVYKFSTVDFPGVSESKVMAYTGGVSVGSYYDFPVGQHGFTFKGGTYRTFDPPNAQSSRVLDRNSRGQMVGGFTDLSGLYHGYLYSNGTFTTIDYPGSTFTEATAINNSGVIVGRYMDSSGDGRVHAFVDNAGHFISFDYPGTVYLTEPWGINSAGDIVGFWSSQNGWSGFLLSGGTFTSLDVPGAASTYAYGINDLGVIAGRYDDANFVPNGWVYSGTFRTVNVPGAPRTAWRGINRAGQLSGVFVDALDEEHGVNAK